VSTAALHDDDDDDDYDENNRDVDPKPLKEHTL
jgi:hypothetical protein